jgi:hypothetical protein
MMRFISAQVLLNSDLSMKAQRVYAIPQPTVVSFYMVGFHEDNGIVSVGVLVQDWKTADCLDKHPDMAELEKVLSKHFGLWGLVVKRA